MRKTIFTKNQKYLKKKGLLCCTHLFTIDIYGHFFTCRLSERQTSTVMQLPLSTLYYTFTTFIQWVAEGRYDFRMLPYALKAHLCPKDVEQLKRIQLLYKNGIMICILTRVWIQLLDISYYIPTVLVDLLSI